jgi:hypothetical protein
MRPVFVRELKELAPALVLILVGAVISAVVFTGPLSRELDEMLAFPIAAGVGLGLAQGLLDRWRRGDLFALHRPVPAARMEAVRTLAGVAVALPGIVALVVAHRASTAVELADFAWMEVRGVRIGFYSPPEHLGASEVALLAAFLLAAWAVTRLAAGTTRAAWTLPALVVLPLAGWSLLSHARSFAAATGSALALAALSCLGTVLSIAGGRR